MGIWGATLVLPEQGVRTTLLSSSSDKLSGCNQRSSSAPLKLHRGRECAWSGARRRIKNSLMIMAPVSFSAFGSFAYRSPVILSSNCSAQGSVSFS